MHQTGFFFLFFWLAAGNVTGSFGVGGGSSGGEGGERHFDVTPAPCPLYKRARFGLFFFVILGGHLPTVV